MLKFLYIFTFILIQIAQSANWGLWDSDRSWIGINFNGVTSNYRLWNSGVGDYQNANLGTFSSNTQTLAIQYWDIKTWKSFGGDVTGANLYYRIYEQGSPSGSFTATGGGWLQDLGGGNQKWGKSSSTSIDITGLTEDKTYVLEVYIAVTGTGDPTGTIYDNRSGNNFQATFSTSTAFPVELTSLMAFNTKTGVQLKWTTSTEIQNYGWDIEKRTIKNESISEWEKIGFVAGSANSNSPKEYSYTDKTAIFGQYEYRLKQIDLDGSKDYSQSVKISVGKLPVALKLHENFPNPFNPATTIRFELPQESNVSLIVYNVVGQQVAELINERMTAGIYQKEFNANDLPTGTYIYILKAGDVKIVKKMLLVK